MKVSCCNISCGYYEPHTAREYTILPELKNTLAFVKNIIRNCTDVYPFEAPKPNYGYGTYGGYSAYNGNLFGGSVQGTNYRTLYDRVGDLEDGFELQTADIADLWVEIGELFITLPCRTVSASSATATARFCTEKTDHYG